jgi:ABC-type nickel/cobalt efflux system permease component RcnA
MSAAMTIIVGASFLLIAFFLVWLKFHEHLHFHRHDHGPHSFHTHDREHIYHLSKSGILRRQPPERDRR